jgi:hypothetical protein
MPTLYVLVDFENVQPDLSQLAQTPYKVKIFFGAKQQEGRVPMKLLLATKALGDAWEPVLVSRSGRNAVDMHIAYWIGRLLKEEPDARIHIISGDTDFDPLIESLRKENFEVHRTKSLAELVTRPAARTPVPRAPAPRVAKGRSPPAPKPAPPAPKSAPPVKMPASDKLPGVLKHLRSMKDKPTTRTKLIKWIDTHFSQHGGAQSPRIVERTFEELVRQGFVTQDGTKVGYHLSP